MENTIIVNASCGAVRGRVLESGIKEFLGIPFGRAERFCPAEPVTWEGVKDCLEYGTFAMQPRLPYTEKMDPKRTIDGGEDCLNLNVWSAAREGEKLPVAVYVYGGAFQNGRNSVPSRSGDKFMGSDRMVFVSINYRLGALGFFQLGAGMGEKYKYSGNCGTLDLIASLKWVQENIAAFGGDPDKVTVMGISAGGKIIGSMLTAPRSEGLFGQVVLESGAMQSTRDIATARSVAKSVEEILGVKDEHELLTMPAEKFMQAMGQYCDQPGSTCMFGPVLDGDVIPFDWMERWESGKGWHGRALIGSGHRELGRTAERADFAQIKEQLLYDLFGENNKIAENAFESLKAVDQPDTEKWTRVLSDFMYRFYSDMLAKHLTKEGCPVWMYSYDLYPAAHGVGFKCIMRDLTEEERKADPNQAAVSDQMNLDVRAFILHGEPADAGRWPQYAGKYKMSYDKEIKVMERADDTLKGFPTMVIKR